MKKSFFGNIILILFSTSLTIFLLELLLRFMLFSNVPAFKSLRVARNYAVYIKNPHEDFLNEDFWKLNYLFNRRFNLTNPHPLLGWTGQFDFNTYEHRDESRLNGRRPVLLYGNSFAQCVDTVECFEDIFNADPVFTSGHYLLNYGVGGYGVDQICLLFEHTVERFTDPFIIFSLLTTDMDRCMLSVRDAQKPYFIIGEEGLELKGTPITLSSEEYFKQNRPEITSYIFNRLRNSKIYPFHPSEKTREEYIDRLLELNTLILERVLTELEQMDLDYVILIFQPEHHPPTDWRLVFLRDFMESRNIPYICDVDIRDADTTFTDYESSRYAIPNNGHPTSYLNRLVSEELMKIIPVGDYRAQINRQKLDWKEQMDQKKIADYIERIRRSPQWLEHVQGKADQKGISLDSMLILDAIYLLNTEDEREQK